MQFLYNALVDYATTVNLDVVTNNLCLTALVTGTLIVDTTAVSDGDLILVKDQTDATQNGVYDVVDAGSGVTKFKLKRNKKFLYLQSGSIIIVKLGEENYLRQWVFCVSELFTIGVTAMVYTFVKNIAEYINYDNTNSGLDATNVQDAIDELNGNDKPVFLSLDNPTAQLVPISTPIMWDTVVEDASSMYNVGTGIITIPKDGLWQIHTRVTINEASMANFPASFFQHIIILSKNTPFPDGFTIRFIAIYQDNFTINVPPILVVKQVPMQGTEVIRLSAGDELSVQLSSTTFAPVAGSVSTAISGTVCLNCCTFTRLGD